MLARDVFLFSFAIILISLLVHVKQELMEINDLMRKQSEELASIKKLSMKTFDVLDSAIVSTQETNDIDLDEDQNFDPKELYRRVLDEYIKVLKPWENVTTEIEETEE